MPSSPPLTSQSEDFPRWYQDVVAKAELADNGPIRGTIVIRPYGYAIWERMQSEVDDRIKQMGVENAYFPLLIPESYIERESSHIEGFSPELAVVTMGGGKELEEPAIIRPTSETIINNFFAKWVNSHRDLPLKINQWANVMRWEMRPRVFLRTSEFLWQEGHTAHADKEEAWRFATDILQNVYFDFMTKVMAIPVVKGLKTDDERFPGADASLTCEAMMKDGKALQMGTSHALGQNFSKMFNIKYLDSDGEHFVWQTSWGVSTRMVGGLIMAHGDDKGLNLPPAIAPTQIVIVPVREAEDAPEGSGVVETAQKLQKELQKRKVFGEKARVACDDIEKGSFGRRSTDWEIKGVPIRVEIGPRDIAEQKAVMVRRFEVSSEKETPKEAISMDKIAETAIKELESAQKQLFDKAQSFMDSNTAEVSSLKEAVEASEDGFARMAWDEIGPSGEKVLAADGVTVRCLVRSDESLPESTSEEGLTAILAKAY